MMELVWMLFVAAFSEADGFITREVTFLKKPQKEGFALTDLTLLQPAPSPFVCVVDCLVTYGCTAIYYREVDGACYAYHHNGPMLLSNDTVAESGFKFYDSRNINADKNGTEYVNMGSWSYKLYSAPKTWWNARSVCQNNGGDLVVFSKDEKWISFMDSISHSTVYYTGKYFIGLSDIITEKQWMWIDGTSADDFLHFADNQPNNFDIKTLSSADCGAFSFSKLSVVDSSCYRELPFICENSNI